MHICIYVEVCYNEPQGKKVNACTDAIWYCVAYHTLISIGKVLFFLKPVENSPHMF